MQRGEAKRFHVRRKTTNTEAYSTCCQFPKTEASLPRGNVSTAMQHSSYRDSFICLLTSQPQWECKHCLAFVNVYEHPSTFMIQTHTAAHLRLDDIKLVCPLSAEKWWVAEVKVKCCWPPPLQMCLVVYVTLSGYTRRQKRGRCVVWI